MFDVGSRKSFENLDKWLQVSSGPDQLLKISRGRDKLILPLTQVLLPRPPPLTLLPLTPPPHLSKEAQRFGATNLVGVVVANKVRLL